MTPSEDQDSKILRELGQAHAVLDELEVAAQAQKAFAALVTINAARDLADYIGALRTASRCAVGFASLKASRDIETARRQLNLWIARLLITLRGSAAATG
jgi:hypothetical protein